MSATEIEGRSGGDISPLDSADADGNMAAQSSATSMHDDICKGRLYVSESAARLSDHRVSSSTTEVLDQLVVLFMLLVLPISDFFPRYFVRLSPTVCVVI